MVSANTPISCLERLVSEMTYYLLSAILNYTRSLSHFE